MKKKIGELTLKEATNLCDNRCGECALWNVCEVLNWNILALALANQNSKLLEQEIEVKEDA